MDISVTIETSFLGSQLEQAVQKVAIKPRIQISSYGAGSPLYYNLGQNGDESRPSYYLFANDNPQIEQSNRYHKLTAKAYGVKGDDYAHENSQLKEFIEKIRQTLLGLGGEVVIEFAGRRYRCPPDIYETKCLALPDGTLLAVSWLDENQTVPIFKEVDQDCFSEIYISPIKGFFCYSSDYW
jgi:hypothetical protein